MASKQELEVQVQNLQREVKDLTEQLARASEGLPPLPPNDGRFELLQEEYGKQVDRNSELSQALAACKESADKAWRFVADSATSEANLLEQLAELKASSQSGGEIVRVTDAKAVHDEIHNRNMDWDQPVAILKR